MAVDLLNIGNSALYAARKNLETTGHNIANANTPGYSRQRVNQTTAPPIAEGGHIMGSGVRVNDVNRIHDEWAEKRVHKYTTSNEFSKERALHLGQVEEIFNESQAEGLNTIINNFFNSFRELSANPENETVKSIVRENASLITKDMKRMKKDLNDLVKNIDGKLKSYTQDINLILKHLSKLNIEIHNMEVIHGETGDLRDQRDLALKNLSEYMKIHTYKDGRGQFIVNGVGIGSLVSGGEVQELVVADVPTEKTPNGYNGSREIFFKSNLTDPITNNLNSGKFRALLDTRNHEVKHLQNHLDDIAYNLINSVNALHNKGYAHKLVKVDKNGNVAPSDMAKNKGINFFEPVAHKKFAADFMNLSEAVKEDLANIATGLNPNSPGDNRVAIAISKIQHEKLLANGSATLEEEYLKSVGNIGLISQKSRVQMEQTESILAQVKALKERTSGVSLDEETANMIRHQKVFKASAKVMSAADTMFQSVLNMVGR